MNLINRHIILPAIVPTLFFAVAATPVDVLGCRNRGLLAGLIVLVGALSALGAAIMGLKGRLHGDPHAHWWIPSALILAIPAAAVVIIAHAR
jgi:hypothetical protein